MDFRKTEAKYFDVQGWTGQISLKRLGNSDFQRGCFCRLGQQEKRAAGGNRGD